VQAVRAFRSKMTQTAQTPQGSMNLQMEATIALPDRLRASIQSPNGNLTMVFTPTSAFMIAPDGSVRDIPPSHQKEALEQIKRDPVFVAQHLDDPAFTFAADGAQKIGEVETRIVDISAAGAAFRYYIDPQSGRILRETYTGMGPSGPFQGETDLADWKEVGGLVLPMKHLNKQDGKDSSAVEVIELQLNPPLDPSLFQKPATPAR
jgi:hypothetical protein